MSAPVKPTVIYLTSEGHMVERFERVANTGGIVHLLTWCEPHRVRMCHEAGLGVWNPAARAACPLCEWARTRHG